MALKPRFKKNIKRIEIDRILYLNNIIENINLEDNDKDLNIDMFYGIGGIGKTTLLKQLEEKISSNKNIIHSNINLETTKEIDKIYISLLEKLGKKINFFYTNIALSIYWKKLNPNIEYKNSTLPFFEESSFLANSLSLVEDLAAVSLSSGLVSLAFKYAKKIKYNVNIVYKEELEELNDLSINEIEELLPKFLSYDINIFLEKNSKKKLLLMFDTHESLYENNKKDSFILKSDSWLRDIITTLYNSKIHFVITGREKLRWELEDEEWQEHLTQIPLTSLTYEETIEYLKNNGIEDINIQKIIYENSDGVPFYLSLSIDNYENLENPKPEDFGKSKKELLDRFFLYLNKTESSTMRVLSVPITFDKSIFEYLVKEFNTGFQFTEFASLINYSFIQEEEKGYVFHKTMRKSILDYLDNDLYIEVNKKMVSYLLNKINFKNIEKKDFEYFKDILYHLKNYMNEEDILNFFEKYISKFTITTNLVELINLYDYLLENIIKNNIQKYQIEQCFFLLKIGRHNQVLEVLKSFNNMEIHYNLLGKMYFLKGEYYNAQKKTNNELILSFYKKSEKYINKDNEFNVKLYIELGNSYRKLKNYSKSLSYFDKANKILEFDKNIDISIKFDLYIKFVYIYKDMNKFNLSENYLNLSLNLLNKYKLNEYFYGIYYRARANVNFKNSRNYLEAKNDFIKSIEYFDSILGEDNNKSLSCYYNLTNIYFKTKENIEKTPFNKNIILNLLNLNIKEGNFSTIIDQKNFFKDIYKEEPEKLFSIYKKILNTLNNSLGEEQHILNEEMEILLDMQEVLSEFMENEEVQFEMKKIFLDFYLNKKEFTEAENFCLSIINELEKKNDKKNIKVFYQNLNEIFSETMKINKLFNYFQERIELYKNNNDMFSFFGGILIKSVLNFSEREELIDEIINSMIQRNMKRQLFNIYLSLSEYYRSELDTNTTISYLEKALQLFDANNIDYYEYRIDNVYIKMIEIYEEMFDINKLEELYIKQLKLREFKKENYFKLAKTYGFLSKFYLENSKVTQAETYLIKELEIWEEKENSEKILILYKSLNKFYSLHKLDNDMRNKYADLFFKENLKMIKNVSLLQKFYKENLKMFSTDSVLLNEYSLKFNELNNNNNR